MRSPTRGCAVRHAPRAHQRGVHAVRAGLQPAGHRGPHRARCRLPGPGANIGLPRLGACVPGRVGIPHTLAGLKVDDKKFDLMSRMAPKDPTAGGNPLAIDEAPCRRLYERALAARVSGPPPADGARESLGHAIRRVRSPRLGRCHSAALRKPAEADRGLRPAGLRSYHLAEHHATPWGLAPSPSVFLAAVAQRTRRLRFGPLVYTLRCTTRCASPRRSACSTR